MFVHPSDVKRLQPFRRVSCAETCTILQLPSYSHYTKKQFAPLYSSRPTPIIANKRRQTGNIKSSTLLIHKGTLSSSSTCPIWHSFIPLWDSTRWTLSRPHLLRPTMRSRYLWNVKVGGESAHRDAIWLLRTVHQFDESERLPRFTMATKFGPQTYHLRQADISSEKIKKIRMTKYPLSLWATISHAPSTF